MNVMITAAFWCREREMAEIGAADSNRYTRTRYHTKSEGIRHQALVSAREMPTTTLPQKLRLRGVQLQAIGCRPNRKSVQSSALLLNSRHCTIWVTINVGRYMISK